MLTLLLSRLPFILVSAFFILKGCSQILRIRSGGGAREPLLGEIVGWRMAEDGFQPVVRFQSGDDQHEFLASDHFQVAKWPVDRPVHVFLVTGDISSARLGRPLTWEPVLLILAGFAALSLAFLPGEWTNSSSVPA